MRKQKRIEESKSESENESEIESDEEFSPRNSKKEKKNRKEERVFFESFKILKVLGSGAFGKVYKVIFLNWGKYAQWMNQGWEKGYKENLCNESIKKEKLDS